MPRSPIFSGSWLGSGPALTSEAALALRDHPDPRVYALPRLVGGQDGAGLKDLPDRQYEGVRQSQAAVPGAELGGRPGRLPVYRMHVVDDRVAKCLRAPNRLTT